MRFKVGLSPFQKVGFICFNENYLKMTNNPFYFILKALFVLNPVQDGGGRGRKVYLPVFPL